MVKTNRPMGIYWYINTLCLFKSQNYVNDISAYLTCLKAAFFAFLLLHLASQQKSMGCLLWWGTGGTERNPEWPCPQAVPSRIQQSRHTGQSSDNLLCTGGRRLKQLKQGEGGAVSAALPNLWVSGMSKLANKGGEGGGKRLSRQRHPQEQSYGSEKWLSVRKEIQWFLVVT